MTSDGEWTWKFAPRAAEQFDGLDPHVQDRVVSKLDEVIASEWRDPSEYLEANSPIDPAGASIVPLDLPQRGR